MEQLIMKRNASVFEHGRRFSRHEDIEGYMISVFGEKFAEYRRRWTATMQRETLPEATPPAPYYLSVGLTNVCNLSCFFCYRHSSSMAVNRASLPIDLVRSLMAEAGEMGIDSLDIGGGGEVLTYPDLAHALELVANAGFKDVFLPTNGLLLKGDILGRVVESVTRINVSIDAASPETYRITRGGDYDSLLRNIDAFLDMRERRNLRKPILRVSFIVMRENRHEVDAFLEKWLNIADIVDFQDLVTYPDHDALQTENLPIAFSHCADPFRTLKITSLKVISPCCSGYSKYFEIGTYPEITLRQAWNSDIIANLRRDLWNAEYPLVCRNCRNRGFEKG